jgi:murein DD-endopeptidase MepM/ murein hydrolase activator NlpD
MKAPKEIIFINQPGQSRYFRLTTPVSFLLTSVILFLCASYLLFGILTVARVSNKICVILSSAKLERIQKHFKDMTAYTTSQEMRMDNLFVADDERREVAGANPIKSEIREVGIGGPSTLADYERIFLFKDDLERKTLDDRIEKLLRQSDLQLYSLSDFEAFYSKKKSAMDHIPAVQPVGGSFMSGFGMRVHPVFHTRRMHKGQDIANTVGTPIIASAEATAKTGVSESFGTYVLLNHDNGFTTIYAHLQAVNVTDNQPVHRGQIIGYLGNSGLSTGPHLHYEVHLNRIPVDPNPYILPENFIVD